MQAQPGHQAQLARAAEFASHYSNDPRPIRVPVHPNASKSSAAHHTPGITSFVVDVACGAEHTVALVSDGRLLVMGNNDFGQLGLPRVKRAHETDDNSRVSKPETRTRGVMLPTQSADYSSGSCFPWRNLSCGEDSTFVLYAPQHEKTGLGSMPWHGHNAGWPGR